MRRQRIEVTQERDSKDREDIQRLIFCICSSVFDMPLPSDIPSTVHDPTMDEPLRREETEVISSSTKMKSSNRHTEITNPTLRSTRIIHGQQTTKRVTDETKLPQSHEIARGQRLG